MLKSAQIPASVQLTHSENEPRALTSTQDVVFIAAGAFSGLKGLIERSGGADIGFGGEPSGRDEHPIAVSYTADEMDLVRNFQSYGFLPELIGRFQRIVPFQALERGELRRILEDRVLRQYQNEFRLDGIGLEVEPEVLEQIVSRSLRMETGARGIDAAFIQHLEEAAFAAYSQEGVRRVHLHLHDGRVGFELA